MFIGNRSLEVMNDNNEDLTNDSINDSYENIDILEIFQSQKNSGLNLNKGRRKRRIFPHLSLELYIGTDYSRHLFYFQVEIPDSETKYSINSDVHYKYIDINIKTKNEKNYLYIYLKDNEFVSPFAAMIDSIYKDIKKARIQNRNKLFDLIIDLVEQWSRFFDKISRLGRDKIYGLACELSFILELLNMGIQPERVINIWDGPNHSAHDFIFDKFDIEIKYVDVKELIKISSEYQLQHMNDKKLYLQIYRANMDTPPVSLNNLIDDISTKLNDEELIRKFYHKVEKYGFYKNIHGEIEGNRHLYIEKDLVLDISDEFPKLIRNNIDYRLIDIRYKIRLKEVIEYRINKELKEIINE